MITTSKTTVLAIMGSPNRGGNTEILLDAVIAGLEEREIEIKKLIPSELEIGPCRNCSGCSNDAQCVIEDEMVNIYHRLKTSACVIIASPLYFMGIPAQTKALIDRCQALWVEKYIIGHDKLPRSLGEGASDRYIGAFICTGGQNLKGMFDGAEQTIRAFFTTLDVELVETLYFSRIEPGMISEHPTALRDAQVLGNKLLTYLESTNGRTRMGSGE